MEGFAGESEDGDTFFLPCSVLRGGVGELALHLVSSRGLALGDGCAAGSAGGVCAHWARFMLGDGVESRSGLGGRAGFSVINISS